MNFFAKDLRKNFPFFITHWEKLPDWFLHFYNFGVLAFVCRTFMGTWTAFWFATASNVVYELKDAAFRVETIGRFGGDGFSIKDFCFAQAGIVGFLYLASKPDFLELTIWAIFVIYLVGIIYKTVKAKRREQE